MAAALLLLLAVVAALHRPLGGAALGLGAAALPLAADELGWPATALLALAALPLAERARRSLERRLSVLLPERRSWGRLAAATGATALGAAAGGALWRLLAPSGATAGQLALAAGSSAALFVLPTTALELWARWARRGAPAPARLRGLGALAVDAAGWLAGCGIAAVARRAGFPLAALGLALLAALSLEAARNAFVLAGLERRLSELLRANREAMRRMLAEHPDRAGVARQLLYECRHLLDFALMQCELVARDGGRTSFWASAEGELREGEPQPPKAPPPLPGVHRRPPWKVLDYPLVADGGEVARLRLWCDPRRLDPAGVELLEALLPQMAGSVRSATLDREAREDPLTGAAVRRQLDVRLLAAFDRARETGSTLAVAMIDLDHFKRVNDSWGHAAGDEALRATARVVLDLCRQRDLCARYGGEEFTVLFEDTEGETALEIAERMRRRVESLDFRVDGLPVRLTVSAGVAAFPELHAASGAEIVALADGALYEAKRQGRNRCLLHLGRSRYQTPSGSIVGGENEPPPVAPPRLFA